MITLELMFVTNLLLRLTFSFMKKKQMQLSSLFSVTKEMVLTLPMLLLLSIQQILIKTLFPISFRITRTTTLSLMCSTLVLLM